MLASLMFRSILRWLLALFFVVAGINHFVNPQPYLAMMPKFLPAPEVLHMTAAIAEILCGTAILIKPWRRLAAWGLIAILIAVFPANISIALNGWEGFNIPRWVLWARLPFQFVFIAWVWWTCLAPASANHRR